VNALAELHGDYVSSVAAAHNVPVDVPATLSLAALATAAAKKATVSIRLDAAQHVALWIVVGLRSGEGKTPAMEEVVRPLTRAEQRMREEAREPMRQVEIQRRVLQRRRHHLEGVAARTGDPAQREARLLEAQEVAAELDLLADQHVPRLIVGDITPEALVVQLGQQKGRIALLSDEGNELFCGLRRRAIGGDEHVDHLLKAYSGAPITVDRKGSGTIIVRDPALTIGVAAQPVVIHDLIRGHGHRARGFLERFLFSVPEPLMARVQGLSGIDQEGQREFVATVNRLLELPVLERGMVGGVEPPRLVIDGEAAEALDSFAAEIDRRSRGDGDLAAMFEWCSKLRGNVARIAALLHLYDDPSGPEPGQRVEISRQTVERAIKIGRYFIGHAQTAYGIGTLVGDDDLHAVLGWIRRNGQVRFRVRDLHRGVQYRLPSADGLKRVLGVMLDDGYIRPAAREGGTLGRRPTEYEVHPAVLGQHDTMTDLRTSVSEAKHSDQEEIGQPQQSVIVSSTTPPVEPISPAGDDLGKAPGSGPTA
jgi:replicative DNA helicase